MKRAWVSTAAMLAVTICGTFMAGPAWAANDQQASGGSTGSTSYQPVTEQPINKPSEGGDPSGSIIGYQPIPDNALASATSSAPFAGMPPMTPTNIQPAAVGQRPQPGQRPVYDYTMWFIGQGPYTLGRDDVIHIQVRNQAEFNGDFIVGPEGEIQYSYLGDIKVVGKTKTEVEAMLTTLLEKYVRSPQVNITVVAYNSKAVYILGEVSRPGKYIMRGDVIKLREAIIAAGMPTHYAALKRTHVIKPDIDKPQDRKVNLKRILYKGKLEEDIDLHPGEIVVVPSTVLSSINDFLSQILNPVTRAAAAAAMGVGL